MSEQFRITLEEYPIRWIVRLYGAQDEHLELLRNAFSRDIIVRDNELRILSENAATFYGTESVVKALFNMMEVHIDVSGRNIEYACRLAKLNRPQELSMVCQKTVGKTVSGKLAYPKAIGQRYLFKCMCNSEIVSMTGVTGVGKTYLVVVYAADLLKKEEVHKITLTRFAVKAGGNLGFLPDDLKEKVDPYLRPFYDALHDMSRQEQVEKLLEKEIIEIAPLAYMRRRTLDNTFIILDGAQNATRAQVKMFLTRIGFHLHIVITGDAAQIDLIKKRDPDLLNAKYLPSGIEGISFMELTSLDVVRNPLARRAIERYEQEEGRYGEDSIDWRRR